MGVFNPVLATERLGATEDACVARVLSAWAVSSQAAIALFTALGGVLASVTEPRIAIAVAGTLLSGHAAAAAARTAGRPVIAGPQWSAARGRALRLGRGLSRPLGGAGCPVALGGAGPGLGRLGLPVLGRSRGDQRAEQGPGASVTATTAASKAASLALEGLVEPLILRTYCSAAAWTSSSVAGGSKLWRVRMLRHMRQHARPRWKPPPAPAAQRTKGAVDAAPFAVHLAAISARGLLRAGGTNPGAQNGGVAGETPLSGVSHPT